MNNESLVDRWRPETLDDIYGHPTAIRKIKNWAENWENGTEPLLLHGPAGTGKTSTAEALANDFGWDYVEVNASEKRRKDDMDILVQEIRSTRESRCLFVLDEVDSIRGTSLTNLYKVLEYAPNPIICTANEKWKVPDGLESRCQKHKFNLQQRSIKKFLKDVVEEEGIDISSREIGQLATRNGIRDALNDLQEYTKSGKTDWDSRNTDDSPFAVVRRILQNKNYIGDMTPDDKVHFLNENIKNEFDGVEAMRSYQAIAEADRWLGHVNRTQDYTWWRYAGSIAEEVANMRITEPYGDWLNVNYPSSRYRSNTSVTSEAPEAVLYRELTNYDQSEFIASFGFVEFQRFVLPLLQDMEEEEKKELILSNNISTDGMKALDINSSEFDGWEMTEVDRDEKDTNNDGPEEGEGKGVLAY